MQVPKRRFCSHPRHLALVPVCMDVGADVQVVSVLGSWNMAACVVVVMEWRTEKTRSARSKWNGRMKAQMVYKSACHAPVRWM
jgi:hypothetical protein